MQLEGEGLIMQLEGEGLTMQLKRELEGSSEVWSQCHLNW